MRHPIGWVTIEKYIELTGDTFSAAIARTASGEWVRSTHFKEVDGRLWIGLAAVEGWLDVHTHQAEVVSPQRASPDLSAELWDMGDVATYLKRNVQVVRESMACLPSFPKAIRLPSKGRARPLYAADEVRDWAKMHKDTN